MKNKNRSSLFRLPYRYYDGSTPPAVVYRGDPVKIKKVICAIVSGAIPLAIFTGDAGDIKTTLVEPGSPGFV